MAGDRADAGTGKSAPGTGAPLFDKGAYFIGKAVWGKGYSELLERLAEQKAVLDGAAMPIDIFGTGEDLDEACLLPSTLFGYAMALTSRVMPYLSVYPATSCASVSMCSLPSARCCIAKPSVLL